MKYLTILCTLVLLSNAVFSQKKDCNISIVTDDFTGKKKISSSNIIIMEKLYIGEALANIDKAPWRITLGFFKEDELLLVIRHESNGIKTTSIVDVLDIKFNDGSVISLDKPIEGKYSANTLKENAHQKTFFALSNEQFKLFRDNLIIKCRVKFREHPNEQEFQKEINKTKAQRIQTEAKCFAESLQEFGK